MIAVTFASVSIRVSSSTGELRDRIGAFLFHRLGQQRDRRVAFLHFPLENLALFSGEAIIAVEPICPILVADTDHVVSIEAPDDIPSDVRKVSHDPPPRQQGIPLGPPIWPGPPRQSRGTAAS